MERSLKDLLATWAERRSDSAILKVHPLDRLRSRGLPTQHLRNISWTLGAQILSIPIRFARFVFLARLLGIEQYGLYTAVTAVALFAAPFSGWGFTFLMARNVARDGSTFSLWWGNCLAAVAATGVPLTVLLSLFGAMILPGTEAVLLLAIGLAELVFVRVIDCAERAHRAKWSMDIAAAIAVLPEVSRLLAILPFYVLGGDSVTVWALWQLVVLGACGVGTGLLVSFRLGRPDPSLNVMRQHLRQGTHFAIGQSAGGIYTNVDRVMLGRLSTFGAVGVYSAGITVLNMVKMPVTSLSRAMMTRYFELGNVSVSATLRFALKNVGVGLIYAVPASIALIVGAPFLPLVLGEEFGESVSAIRWLATLPILFVLTDVAGMTLGAIDRPQDRTKILVVMALFNILLNFLLIPDHGWRGAIGATLVSEVGLGLLLWGAILHRRRVSIRD